VEPKPVSWLWPDRLPYGKLAVMAGEPGEGKSRLMASIAATVSRRGLWPAGEGRADVGEVLIASFEDDHADTTVPRLMAEGADLTKIRFLEGVPGENGRRAFDINRDVGRLEEHLKMYPDTRLIGIDPISAAMIGTDSHKNSDVRASLHPLGELAQHHGVCVLAITHLNKGSGAKALHRVIGSIAFIAAARVAFAVAKDESDPDGNRRLFLPIKNNLGNDRTGLSFTTGVVDLPGGISAPRICWGLDAVDTTADEALAPDEERSAVEEAKDFLRDLLAAGPMKSEDVKAAAHKARISSRTLWRAKDKFRIRAEKYEVRGPWYWKIP
jgi:putative DNA primase/helicase